MPAARSTYPELDPSSAITPYDKKWRHRQLFPPDTTRTSTLPAGDAQSQRSSGTDDALFFHEDYCRVSWRAPTLTIRAAGGTPRELNFLIKRSFVEASSDVFTKLLEPQEDGQNTTLDVPYSPDTISHFLSFYTSPDPLALLHALPDAGAYADLYAFARTYQVRLLLAALEGEGNRVWEGVVRKDPLGAYVIACFMEREAERKDERDRLAVAAAARKATMAETPPPVRPCTTKILQAVTGMHHAFYPVALESGGERVEWRVHASFQADRTLQDLAPRTMGASPGKTAARRPVYAHNHPLRNLPETVFWLYDKLGRAHPLSPGTAAPPPATPPDAEDKQNPEMTARDVLALSYAIEDGLRRFAETHNRSDASSDASGAVAAEGPAGTAEAMADKTDGRKHGAIDSTATGDDMVDNAALWGGIAQDVLKQRWYLAGMSVP